MKVKIFTAIDEGEFHGSPGSVARSVEQQVNEWLAATPGAAVMYQSTAAYSAVVPYAQDRGARAYFVHILTIFYSEPVQVR